jgi:3-oxoacyl-[acyl-carrier-protein] synthase II
MKNEELIMNEPIVVTGWGMITPLDANADQTWRALMALEAACQPLEGPEWAGFDAPKAAQVMDAWVPQRVVRRDRSLQFGETAAEEAWRKAGLRTLPPGRIGTTFSSSKGGLASLLAASGDPSTVTWDFLSDFFPHEAGALLMERFGFSGPSLSFASACSTGIASIAFGARLILDGECDAVLAGSTEASIHPLIYAGFQNMGLLTRRKEGPAPFDQKRDGFLMGEGAAVMVLESERSAQKRKAPILAHLSGWALGADSHHPLELEAHGDTIVSLINKALGKASLKPSEIGYINAHGTGTKLNDLVESKAISKAFGKGGPWVSSTKGATGHLLGAAGSVEAVLAAMVLEKGEMPDTRHLENPDPKCKLKHVKKGGIQQKVDHVMSLSYGFGGQLGAVIFSKV